MEHPRTLSRKPAPHGQGDVHRQWGKVRGEPEDLDLVLQIQIQRAQIQPLTNAKNNNTLSWHSSYDFGSP